MMVRAKIITQLQGFNWTSSAHYMAKGLTGEMPSKFDGLCKRKLAGQFLEIMVLVWFRLLPNKTMIKREWPLFSTSFIPTITPSLHR